MGRSRKDAAVAQRASKVGQTDRKFSDRFLHSKRNPPGVNRRARRFAQCVVVAGIEVSAAISRADSITKPFEDETEAIGMSMVN